MRRLSFAIIALVAAQLLNAQATPKNYILEIDGDTIHISLDQPSTFKTAKGQTYKVKVSKKEFANFTNEFISFDHPSQFSLSSKMIDEDIQQILLMSATGNGLMIQVYSSINPELAVDLMLNQVTQDDISAGYKQTLTETQRVVGDGVVFKGKKAVLKMDDDTEEFTCYANGKKKKGILIMEIRNDIEDAEATKMFEVFWKTLSIKY